MSDDNFDPLSRRVLSVPDADGMDSVLLNDGTMAALAKAEGKAMTADINERAFGVKLLQFLGVETADVTGFTLSIALDDAPRLTITKYIHRSVFGMCRSKEASSSLPLAGMLDPDKVENFERFMVGQTLDGRKGG